MADVGHFLTHYHVGMTGTLRGAGQAHLTAEEIRLLESDFWRSGRRSEEAAGQSNLCLSPLGQLPRMGDSQQVTETHIQLA